MSQLNQRLLDYLRLPNPQLDCKRWQKGNVVGKLTDHNSPANTVKWKNFESDALKAISSGELKDALECRYEFHDHSDIPRFPFCEIHDKQSFESLLVKSNHTIVSDALAKAQTHLRVRPEMFMVRGGQAIPPQRRGRCPDWAGIHGHRNGNTRPNNILPGITIFNIEGSEHDIPWSEKEHLNLENWIDPVRQLLAYCTKANARYGYILTEKELVAVRVQPCPDHKPPEDCETKSAAARTGDAGLLEFFAIPWKNGMQENFDGLTINLTLWYLHMIAAKGSEIDDDYPSLEVFKKDDQSTAHESDAAQGPSSHQATPQGTNPDDIDEANTRDTMTILSEVSIEEREGSTKPMFKASGRKRPRNEQTKDQNQDKAQKRQKFVKG
ncbi:MAG: hypothetical protein Q9190_007803 [Brigantiaea leucoxantha]